MDENAAGIFVGVSAGDCLVSEGSTWVDEDADGLADLCEAALADSFAPELSYHIGDRVGREPYWAAQPAGSGSVIIAYLLSYYQDLGCAADLCGLVGGDHAAAHRGDSEDIYLTVYYNSNTHHWVLDKAAYSRHYGYGLYYREGREYPSLVYPSKMGGYPRAYVSEWKHANYSTEDECDSGNALEMDTCPGDNVAVRARVETHSPSIFYPVWYNIGSWAVPFRDCVPSRDNSLSGNGRYECYWTYRRFRGWYPNDDSGEADAYSVKLAAMHFIPPFVPSHECGHWETRPVLDGNWEETGSYEMRFVPEACDTPPCTSGHWESQPILDDNWEETGSYEMVWVPDPGCV